MIKRTKSTYGKAVKAEAIDRRSKVMTLAWKCKKSHSDMSFSSCLVWAWKTVEELFIVTFEDGSKKLLQICPIDTDLGKKRAAKAQKIHTKAAAEARKLFMSNI